MKEIREIVSVNRNLITLKCVLFLFFGGLGSLLPFLPEHMSKLGLSKDEATVISVVAPAIAVLGPLVAAPLADKLAGGSGGNSRSKTGKYLRVMIALCLILATIFYWLLATIDPIIRSPPEVSFVCDPEGGAIIQARCGDERRCYDWGSQRGSIQVKGCKFSCNSTVHYKADETVLIPEELIGSSESGTTDESYYDDSTAYPVEAEFSNNENPNPSPNVGIYPHPHMCHHNAEGEVICDVFTEYSKNLSFDLSLKPSITERITDREVLDANEDACIYPFDSYFHCRITEETKRDLIKFEDPQCNPKVICEIHDPYNNTNSLLKRSQCGYNNIGFAIYIVFRSIADIFLAAAVALLNTAVVIATRETSTGRGDIGKQFAAGALGFATFAPIIGGVAGGRFIEAMICFTVLQLLAVLILIFDNKMPLSPPEWWWHTRCGLLALPMSSVRKYGFEIAALGVVLFLLGVFWNAIDAFLPWHVMKLPEGNMLIVGFTITIGALPAVLFLIFAERIIDYCSHSNILIACFVNYIIHHVALICVKDPCILLIFEILEIFTLHLMWVTAICYLRHIVPKRFTACGQALPVIAHFCSGRCIGALLGSLAYTEYSENFARVHKGFAGAAAVVAVIYFLLYHLYLKPKCLAPPQLPPYPAPSVVQSMNGNGSYTPLRVYHNGRAKKGHFRY